MLNWSLHCSICSRKSAKYIQSEFNYQSKLERNNLSIPRLQLVVAHMSANLAEEKRKKKKEKRSVRKKYAWSNSTAVVLWLKDNGENKTFVSNRCAQDVVKVKLLKYVITFSVKRSAPGLIR